MTDRTLPELRTEALELLRHDLCEGHTHQVRQSLRIIDALEADERERGEAMTATRRAELRRLRELRADVRQWVRDAYALGFVPDSGAAREMLDELAAIARVARP